MFECRAMLASLSSHSPLSTVGSVSAPSRLAAKIDSPAADFSKTWDRKTVPKRARLDVVVNKSGTVFRSPLFARAVDTDLFRRTCFAGPRARPQRDFQSSPPFTSRARMCCPVLPSTFHLQLSPTVRHRKPHTHFFFCALARIECSGKARAPRAYSLRQVPTRN